MKLADVDRVTTLPRSRLHLQLAGNEGLADQLSWAYNEALFLAMKIVRNTEELESVDGALKAMMAKRRIVEAEVEAYGIGLRYGYFLQIPQELWDSCKEKAKWQEAAKKVGPALAEDDDVRDAIVRLRSVTQRIGELRRSKTRLTEALERLPKDPQEVRALAARAMRAVADGQLNSPFIGELLRLVHESPYLARSRRRPRRDEGPVVSAPRAIQDPTAVRSERTQDGQKVIRWCEDGFIIDTTLAPDVLDDDTVRELCGRAAAVGELRGKWGDHDVVVRGTLVRVLGVEEYEIVD